MHYARWQKEGDPGEAAPRRRAPFTGTLTTRGYWQIARNGIRVMEHRAVMEGLLGRALAPRETVHHVNGVRTDNRAENLELWSKNHGTGQRVSDQVAWALQVLGDYAPHRLS